MEPNQWLSLSFLFYFYNKHLQGAYYVQSLFWALYTLTIHLIFMAILGSLCYYSVFTDVETKAWGG